MRQLALLTAALALATAALAEDAPGAKSDITIVESNPSAGDAASNSGG
jgi:ABC-type proline/glycine betaine transport system substrate-binding protein